MLSRIANAVVKRPFAVILVIVVVTILFSSFIPSMKRGTSMEDFLPNNKIVKANQKVMDYFGGRYEVLMAYVEGKNVTAPHTIREENRILKELLKKDMVEGVVSLSFFLERACYMEYGKDIDNCSDQEILDAFKDIMTERKRVILLSKPDLDNENIPSFADIKNAYIEDYNDTLIFSIEVKDLSNIKLKVIEWSVSFENKLVPDERIKIYYRISARLEPKPLWIFGKGFIKNIKSISSRPLGCNKNVYLWIKPPGENIYIPVKLKRSTFDIDRDKNQIIIKVNKDDLRPFGIGIKFGNMELPAKLYKIKVETRAYRLSKLNFPWLGFSVDSSLVLRTLNKHGLIGKISKRIIEKFGIGTNKIKELEKFIDENSTVSLLDLDKNWKILDIAPNKGYSRECFLLKPEVMEELKESILEFLPKNKYNSTIIIIQINGSINRDELKKLSKDIDDFLKNGDKDIKFEVTGSGLISYQIDELTSKSNSLIAPGIFIAIILILFLNFKRPSYVVLPMLGLVISVIWLFGTMTLLNMKFNTIAVALVPLIMGLGVDYSVHMFHNYRAEISKGYKPSEAIASSIKDVGTAMFLATITTCISFLSFLSSSVPPLRDFGILCAIGIIYTFIVTISLQASIRYLLDRKKSGEKIRIKNSFLRIGMEKLAKQMSKYRKTIITGVIIVTISMGYMASNLNTSFSMEEFLPEKAPAIKVMEKISKRFPSSSQDQEYILIEGDISRVSVLKGIRKTMMNIRDDEFVSRNPDNSPKIESILSIIDEAVRYNSSLVDRFELDKNNIPKNDKKVKELLEYLYESPDYRGRVRRVLYREGDNFKATLIRIYISPNASNDREGIIYRELNDDIIDFDDVDTIVTGKYSLIYTITKSLTESQMISTFICILLAGLILIIAYRKVILGLISMIPVTLSSIWILGTMYIIGYDLNVMTVMITSLTIGLGVTYAIHAVERYRLVMKKGKNVENAIYETVSHTGGAIIAAALTTMAGFGILVLSPLPPEQQFGVISALSISYALLTTVVVLPPILYIYGKYVEKSINKSSKH